MTGIISLFLLKWPTAIFEAPIFVNLSRHVKTQNFSTRLYFNERVFLYSCHSKATTTVTKKTHRRWFTLKYIHLISCNWYWTEPQRRHSRIPLVQCKIKKVPSTTCICCLPFIRMHYFLSNSKFFFITLSRQIWKLSS